MVKRCIKCRRNDKKVVLLETPFFAQYQGELVGYSTDDPKNKHICFTCFITGNFVDGWTKKKATKR